MGYTAVERRRRREQASRQAEQEGTEARITRGAIHHAEELVAEVREEGADTDYWLEHIQHFADVIFEFFVMLDEVTSPFRRIPNLKFVIHPN